MKRLPHQQNMRTPAWFFAWCNRYFGSFVLDAAASPHNALCGHYYTIRENGLIQPWKDLTFANPPWSNFDWWTDKAFREMEDNKRRSLLIGPAGTSNRWFYDLVVRCSFLEWRLGIYAPVPRLAFDTPEGEPTCGAMWNAFVYTFGYDESHHNKIESISFGICGVSF